MSSDLINVGNFRFVPEAEAARLRLEDEGIQAFLSNAELVNADWFHGNATGWVKILVSDDQAEAARAILADIYEEAQVRRRNRAAGIGSAATCLACGARMPATSAVCSACGWTYAVDLAEIEDDAGDDDDADDDEFVSHADASRESVDERAGGERADSEAADSRHTPTDDAGPPPLDPLNEDAAEKAETDATNFRLLFGIAMGGIIALWLLPKLREAFHQMLP